jgi:hypothetical protein
MGRDSEVARATEARARSKFGALSLSAKAFVHSQPPACMTGRAPTAPPSRLVASIGEKGAIALALQRVAARRDRLTAQYLRQSVGLVLTLGLRPRRATHCNRDVGSQPRILIDILARRGSLSIVGRYC